MYKFLWDSDSSFIQLTQVLNRLVQTFRDHWIEDQTTLDRLLRNSTNIFFSVLKFDFGNSRQVWVSLLSINTAMPLGVWIPCSIFLTVLPWSYSVLVDSGLLLCFTRISTLHEHSTPSVSVILYCMAWVSILADRYPDLRLLLGDYVFSVNCFGHLTLPLSKSVLILSFVVLVIFVCGISSYCFCILFIIRAFPVFCFFIVVIVAD